METTRHFVATVYIVHDGATALHDHGKLDMWLPPGGHIDRDELPHIAAKREVREETGLEVDLAAPTGGVSSETVRSIPQPQQFLLEDINVHEEGISHQHIDFIFYGSVGSHDIDPDGSDELSANVWQWFTAEELRENADWLEPDVVELGQDAIRTVEGDG